MIEFAEPPAGWVPDVPVDAELVPPDESYGSGCDLSPLDELAVVEAVEDQDRRLVMDEIADLDADGVLAAAVAAQRVVNLTQARLLFLASHWADVHAVLDRPHWRGRGCEKLISVGGVGTPELSEFAPAEYGAAVGLTTVSARLLIGDALDLRHRLPRIWHRLQTGTIRAWVARRVATRTRHLTQEAAAKVDLRLCEVVGRVTGSRLEKVLDAAILAADPPQAEADTAEAASKQGVRVGRDTDHGYATMAATGPAPDIHAVDMSLDGIARALSVLGDTDGYHLRRVKAFALLADPEAVLATIRAANEALAATPPDNPADGDLDQPDDDEPTGPTGPADEEPAGPAGGVPGPPDGTDPRRPCVLGRGVLYVHVTDHTLTAALAGVAGGIARVHDVGPVLMRQVSDWLRHRHVTIRPVLDIPGVKAVDRYEFTTQMADALRILSPAAHFPYSTNLTGNGDNDHTHPYLPPDEGGPPGQTGLHNGAWTPRHPHRIKTFGRWKVTQLRPGAWLWRTPHRHYYLVDEHGTTPLGTLT